MIMKKKKYPLIKMKLPGPKAKKLIAKDNKYISRSYTRGYPLVAEKGEGTLIRDPDGNTFLDFTAGIAVTATGHSHPQVVNAIKKQAEKLLHMSGTDFYYESQIKLAEKLASIAPGNLKKSVFFCNSGAEAVEAAIKLSSYYSKKRRFIAFLGAFHGRTTGALSLSASKVVQKKNFSPIVPGVHHIPYAYCYRCVYGMNPEKCDYECLKFLEEELFKKTVDPKDVAAVFVEPIQGEGGYIVPPKEFLPRLKRLTKKYKILLVADEIQTGMGRTGKMFASEHFGIVPDIITIAKGIASGMPLGAIVSSEQIMNWVPGSHASTFGGNPVSCAAALATIDLLEKRLISNAKIVGDYLIKNLKKMQEKYEIMGDVRGIGLMVGVEFVKTRKKKEKYPEARNEIVMKAFEKGLLLLGCGENCLRFCPALTVTKKDVDIALDIIEPIIAKVNSRKIK